MSWYSTLLHFHLWMRANRSNLAWKTSSICAAFGGAAHPSIVANTSARPVEVLAAALICE
jgi:hypothetical protein